MSNYAIIETGGKQYRVQNGDTVRVESLTLKSGSMVELDEVLMICEDDRIRLGSPHVKGAKVTAEVIGHGKGEKVVVFKYKNKTRYRRRNGHRQRYTDLKVTDIS